MKTVYFAGKVSKGGGYRGLLFRDHRVMSEGYTIYEIGGGELVYGGPFALACDHRNYDRVFNELAGDLIALCDPCHGKFHDKLPAFE